MRTRTKKKNKVINNALLRSLFIFLFEVSFFQKEEKGGEKKWS